MRERATNFYIAQLNTLPAERGLYFDHKGAWIRCPNPEHSGGMENTPSLKINIDPGKYQGSFYCFGCKKFKGGWNALAERLRLRKVSSGAKAAHVDFSFKDKFNEQIPDFEQMIPWNANKDWRGIEAATLLKFDTKVTTFGRNQDQINLLFPVTMRGESVGYIRAIQHKPRRDKTGKKERTYFNMDGEWASESLFGYDLARKRIKKLRKLDKKVVLWVVEGPRDTMNVAQHGGVVVGLIGSAVNKHKIALIMDLDPDAIIIATDNDDAGNLAAEWLLNGDTNNEDKKARYKGVGTLIPCIRLKFKDGRDPADLTKKKVQQFIIRARKRAA